MLAKKKRKRKGKMGNFPGKTRRNSAAGGPGGTVVFRRFPGIPAWHCRYARLGCHACGLAATRVAGPPPHTPHLSFHHWAKTQGVYSWLSWETPKFPNAGSPGTVQNCVRVSRCRCVTGHFCGTLFASLDIRNRQEIFTSPFISTYSIYLVPSGTLLASFRSDASQSGRCARGRTPAVGLTGPTPPHRTPLPGCSEGEGTTRDPFGFKQG